MPRFRRGRSSPAHDPPQPRFDKRFYNMRTIHDPAEFRRLCRELRAALENSQPGPLRRLGFVPTMGALHAGHLALVAASRARDQATLASIFVNPLQFGPQEDLARYPRTLAADQAALSQAGVALLFAPAPEAMYPGGFSTRVEVEGLSQRLCGASRPGHFRGVATVVLKLLLLCRPETLYLGRKDAAQVAILRRMISDLNLETSLEIVPIVRDADGLALSSRNLYLSPGERATALALSRALRRIADAYARGERLAQRALAAGRAELQSPALALEYLAAVNADSLLPVEQLGPGALVALAARVGATRLIDNFMILADGEVQL